MTCLVREAWVFVLWSFIVGLESGVHTPRLLVGMHVRPCLFRISPIFYSYLLTKEDKFLSKMKPRHSCVLSRQLHSFFFHPFSITSFLLVPAVVACLPYTVYYNLIVRKKRRVFFSRDFDCERSLSRGGLQNKSKCRCLCLYVKEK